MLKKNKVDIRFIYSDAIKFQPVQAVLVRSVLQPHDGETLRALGEWRWGDGGGGVVLLVGDGVLTELDDAPQLTTDNYVLKVHECIS